MKTIRELFRYESEDIPKWEAELTGPVLGIAQSVVKDLGESPEAFRGAMVAMSTMAQLIKTSMQMAIVMGDGQEAAMELFTSRLIVECVTAFALRPETIAAMEFQEGSHA